MVNFPLDCGPSRFYDRLVNATANFLKKDYEGDLNVSEGADIVVRWSRPIQYGMEMWEIAMHDFFKEEFPKIEGLVIDYFCNHINLTQTTNEAFQTLWEDFSDLWPRAKENTQDGGEMLREWAMDLPQYQVRFNEAEEEEFKDFWKEFLNKTPYYMLPETYWFHQSEDRWGQQLNSQGEENRVTLEGRYSDTFSFENYALDIVAKALNDGAFEIDEDSIYESFLHLVRCTVSEQWGDSRDMISHINGWCYPDALAGRQLRLFQTDAENALIAVVRGIDTQLYTVLHDKPMWVSKHERYSFRFPWTQDNRNHMGQAYRVAAPDFWVELAIINHRLLFLGGQCDDEDVSLRTIFNDIQISLEGE